MVLLGQSTTIAASWDEQEPSPSIVVNNKTILAASPDACTDEQGALTLLAATTLTLWACKSGFTTVELRAGGKLLDTTIITVPPNPDIYESSKVAYRWFNIKWRAHPVFTSFRVEWRNHDESMFKPLSSGGPPEERAIITIIRGQGVRSRSPMPDPPYPPDSNLSADVRGLSFEFLKKVVIRVVGITADNREATSASTPPIDRGYAPVASGHLPDHTMQYSLAHLPTSGDNAELAGWIRDAAPGAATAWSDIVSYVKVCDSHCDDNTDMDVISLKIGPCSDTVHATACVKDKPDSTFIKHRLIYNRRMFFTTDPRIGSDRFEWTTDSSKHGELVSRESRIRYLWITVAAIHEFGHTFGLKDRNGQSDYNGIMDGTDLIDSKLTYITVNDRHALIAIYESHTKDEGW